jgi:hypothetical protein
LTKSTMSDVRIVRFTYRDFAEVPGYPLQLSL